MAQLIYKNKVILSNMKYATGVISISRGLMFASRERVRKGICLVMPMGLGKRYGCAVTMLFCFYSYEILFVSEEYKVVDKVVLKPWKFNYIPKSVCKYVIESEVGIFKDIVIGDKLQIVNED